MFLPPPHSSPFLFFLFSLKYLKQISWWIEKPASLGSSMRQCSLHNVSISCFDHVNAFPNQPTNNLFFSLSSIDLWEAYSDVNFSRERVLPPETHVMLDFSIDIRNLMRQYSKDSASLLFTKDNHLMWFGVDGIVEFHPIVEKWARTIYQNLKRDGSLLYSTLVIVNDGIDAVKDEICVERRKKEHATFLNQWRKIRNPRCK